MTQMPPGGRNPTDIVWARPQGLPLPPLPMPRGMAQGLSLAIELAPEHVLGLRKVQTAYVETDELRRNTSDLAPSAYLWFLVEPHEVWTFEVFIRKHSANVGMRFQWSIPAGGFLMWKRSSANYSTDEMEHGQDDTVNAGHAAIRGGTYDGVYIGGASGGVVNLLFAQLVPDDSDTLLMQGSYIVATRLQP